MERESFTELFEYYKFTSDAVQTSDSIHIAGSCSNDEKVTISKLLVTTEIASEV